MLSQKCYAAWQKRLAQSPLARLCFMAPQELLPIAEVCIDQILARFPDLPDRYRQSYEMSRQSQAREPLLSIILFCLYFIPDCTPYACADLQGSLKDHVANKMTGVYSTLEAFVDGVTMSSILYPV